MPAPVSISKNSERLVVDPEKIRWLKRLVSQGEGQRLEFKAKTNFPDKITHELIAFANSNGGILLIGINDDGNISGVKYPEEDELMIRKAVHKHCWPKIKVKSSIIKVSEKKWVVVLDVLESKRKPVRFKVSRNKQIAYIRYRDKTLQASREAEGILRLKFGKQDVTFSYSEIENQILKALDRNQQASFSDLKKLTGLNEHILSSKLINLAASNVIGWKPLDGSDIFTSQV